MFNYRAIIFALFFTLALQHAGRCQSLADEKLLEQLKKELTLDSSQVASITSVFLDYSIQLDTLNTTIKALQMSDLSEDEIGKKTSILFKERKDLRNWKTERLVYFLSAEQKVKYQKEIVAKARPVLHYGHNKADCKACDKPTMPPFGGK